ncbi:MAG: hypothetical protein AAGL24_26500 [Pseudomonadota bacterium]
MADRWEWYLAGLCLATVLASLWLVSMEGYTRTFLDAAFLQFLCFAEPVQDPVMPVVV